MRVAKSCHVISIPSWLALINTHVSVVVHVKICGVISSFGTGGKASPVGVVLVLRFAFSDTFFGACLNVIAERADCQLAYFGDWVGVTGGAVLFAYIVL